MAAAFDTETLNRVLRAAMSKVKASDFARIVRRTPALRRLVRGPLADFAEDIGTLTAMLKDYASGEYREAPRRTMLAAAAALLYVLNPFDLIPDIVPALGLVDDAAVTALVLRSIRQDLHDYRSWTQKLKRRVRQLTATI